MAGLRKTLTLICLLITATIFQEPYLGIAATSADSAVPVPLVFFDTPHYKIELQLDVAGLQGSILLNKQKTVFLPPQTLPLKILEWNLETLVVFTRDLWTNRIRLWTVDLEQADFHEIVIPERIAFNLFRQAAVYQQQIVFIFYEPLENINYFYRLLPLGAGNPPLVFDDQFRSRFLLNYAYQQQPHILSLEHQGTLFLISDCTIATYTSQPGAGNIPVIDSFSVPARYQIVEAAADAAGVFGLFKDIESPLSPTGRFMLFDILKRCEVKIDFPGEVPYGLRLESGSPRLSFVRTWDDLQRVFLLDLQNMACSGLMSAGSNNYEGEVAWTQSYYLSGFVDLLAAGSGPGSADFPALLNDQIKQRLDLEMALLDRMLAEGPGLSCKFYSVNRAPVIFAVQAGKILLLLKRYLLLTPNPVALNSYANLREQVMSLAGHMEILARAAPDDPWLNGGRYYLKWPKGVPFWADGVGVPYNHQNCWASGVLYGEDPALLAPEVVQAVRDIGAQVLDYEGFRSSPLRQEYSWHYWWGRARVGWQEADDISLNTPAWRGDGETKAASVYRTFDTIAMLVLEEKFPGTLPPGFLDYLKSGVETDGLELFLTKFLSKKPPTIGKPLAAKYLRPVTQTEFRNSVWSHRALYKILPKKNNNPHLYLLLLSSD